jgi:hypothetical protein
MILGVGALIANSVCPWLFQRFTEGTVTNFRGLFLIPCFAASAAAIAMALFFHPPRKGLTSDG